MNFETLPPRVCRRLVAQEKWWINCWDELKPRHTGKLSIWKWLIRESERKWHNFFSYIYYLFGMISSMCPLRVLCAFHIKLSLNAVWWHAWNPITQPSNYMSPLSRFCLGFNGGSTSVSSCSSTPNSATAHPALLWRQTATCHRADPRTALGPIYVNHGHQWMVLIFAKWSSIWLCTSYTLMQYFNQKVYVCHDPHTHLKYVNTAHTLTLARDFCCCWQDGTGSAFGLMCHCGSLETTYFTIGV